ncbi:MAG: peptidoglycan recognition protein [Actinomycetota bacterium]|nr:peptidoglycan recognition protein [Actinomycetota bacterium]
MRLLAAAAFVALAAPGVARAADATLVSRDVSMAAVRSSAALTAARFDLVGLHWQGTGTVRFRTRGLSGRWSSWRTAAPEAEDQPNRGSREAARRSGWRVGNPYWTGGSHRLQVRRTGDVRRLRAFFVRSPEERVPMRSVAIASSPAIVPRLSWSANERITRPPVYADELRFALVHHTAGSNSYTRSQSAAIVRAIQLYHVRGNGWNDVGYNFLVDKYGQVFEGRAGGVDKNVVGAHAEGFNTSSVGVAVLGNYSGAGVSAAAQKAVAGVIAWRLDLAHVDPLSTLSWPSGGNARFPRGAPVFLRAVSGHRDTGFTSCPGSVLYRRIPAIARAAAATGRPKLYTPVARGALGRTVRFTARLTDAVPWTVALYDPQGVPLALGSGTGPAIDWRWDARGAGPGRYSYLFSAGPTVRSAFGTFGGRPPPLRITGLAATPPVISPNADGIDDSTTISYALSATATVTVSLVDAARLTLATLFSEWRPAGRHSFSFTADSIPDGEYAIAVTAATSSSRPVSARTPLFVDRGVPLR